MSRPITVADETHHLEQRTYQERLAARREPENGRADTAATVAAYGLLREIARSHPHRAGESRESREDFISRAAAILEPGAMTGSAPSRPAEAAGTSAGTIPAAAGH